MTYIHRCLMRMGIFLILAATTVILLHQSLKQIFFHNLALNTIILSCLGLGIVLSFFQLFRLQQEQTWLDTYEQGKERFPDAPRAKILAPLAILLSDTKHSNNISPLTARSILASVEGRLDETRDLHRYLVGLLIFLGLLGTFWGLSETIGAITGVINSIDMSGGEVKDAFSSLKKGLQSPLTGMGMAFSSSMFGLASSLIVGFMDLQISKAGSSFYYILEERLAANTRLGGAAESSSMATNSGPAYSLGLLEQTVESMAGLQSLMRRTEDNRVSVIKALQIVGEKLSLMADQMSAHHNVMKKIAQNQIDLQESLIQVTKNPSQTTHNEIVSQHLRSLDATSNKLLEEIVTGRSSTTQELKNEIRVIARTLSAIANGQEIVAA